MFVRTHGQLCHTYESASLRRFDRGRVDNVRSNCPIMLKLAKTLVGLEWDLQTHQQRIETKQLFQEVCQNQQKLIDEVSSFKRFQRHFFSRKNF